MRLASQSFLAIAALALAVSAQQKVPPPTPQVVNIYNSVYCSLFPSLNSCIGSLNATGGYAIVPPGSKLVLTRTLDVGNVNGVPAVLYIQRGGQVIINVGNGPAIRLHKGAMLKCDQGPTQVRDTQGVPEIVMGPAASIDDLVVNATTDGQQQTASIEGCEFFDPGGNTGKISGAVVHWTSLASNTFMRDTQIGAFPTAQIKIENTSGVFSSSYDLDNVVSNCYGLANCVPLLIQANPAGAPSAIRINGGQYVHAGRDRAMIDCEGSGQASANAPYGITIIGTYLEPSTSTNAIGIKIRDCHDVMISGISAAGAGGTDLVNISESAPGLVYGINIHTVYNRGFSKIIRDTVNARTISGASLADYEYSSTSVYDKIMVQSYLSPPMARIRSLRKCASINEGSHAVAKDCSEPCGSGKKCVSGGVTHCELYCNGSEYVETGR
ncbi:MAG TPA: hypothetical protein VJO35_06505 [Terriglobales bacterium]|nr:hypothetical protein [Terriglobales bacterium]